MHDPANNAVALQLPQLLDQHLLGNRGDGSLELREAHQLAVEQLEKDDKLPAPFEHFESLCNFPGSPINLQHIFEIEDGRIVSLEIRP